MHTVAIVGMGFSGTAVARSLVSRLPAGSKLLMVNAGAAMARGLAYGTSSDAHLLNVPAARMSICPHDSANFSAWISARDLPYREHDFVPRSLYGDYLRESLQQALSLRPDLEVATTTQSITSLQRLGDGHFQLGTADGDTLIAARVVLAIGNFAPRAPLADCERLPAGRYANDPWAASALSDLEPDAPLMLVGTGLTMLDMVLSLQRQGHHGPVLAISRRGLLPQAHRPNELPPEGFKLEFALPEGSKSLRALTRSLRAQIAGLALSGMDWRDVWVSLRPITATLWSGLSGAERARFLRHAQVYWDVHRHRAAPGAHAALDEALRNSQVQVRAGRLISVEEGSDRMVRILWRPRGTDAVRQFVAARIINCSGPSTEISERSSPLLARMRANGMLKTCPHGLGLFVDSQHQLLDAHGAPQAGLYYVGPLLKAQYWEATAVPELRVHAEQAALACAASLGC